MSIISTDRQMSFTMSHENVNVNATFEEYISTDPSLFTITPSGELSPNEALKTILATTPTNINIPYEVNGVSVTSIGNWAFSDCQFLTSVTIPDTVISIGYGAFWSCASLTIANISNSVTNIGYQAFYGCTAMTSIVLPNKLEYITSKMLSVCSSLTSINIPSSVKTIASDTFPGCNKLTTINIDKSINSISGSPWGCPNVDAVKWLG